MECVSVLLIEGGSGAYGEVVAGIQDFLCVIGEVCSIFLEGGIRGILFPVAAQFTEGEEGGSFAEGFFEPFVLMLARVKAAADVGELVGELVNELSMVAIFTTELDGNFPTRRALKEGDGPVWVVGDEEGWELLIFWRRKELEGGLEEDANLAL